LFDGLLEVNVMLVVFNLIPAFPMDGGRVLRALLALRMNHAKATRIAATIGQVIAVILMLVGWFGIPGIVSQNIFLTFVALFVFMGARQEAAFTDMRAAVAGMRIADAMITRFQTLGAEMPVTDAATEALHDTQSVYPITDSSMRPLGMVSRNALLQATSGTAGSLAQSIPAVQADASFDEAFRLMQQSGSPVLPVINPAGQLVGIVSLNLLSERARMHKA
jgi:CBS domain-containing protein